MCVREFIWHVLQKEHVRELEESGIPQGSIAIIDPGRIPKTLDSNRCALMPYPMS